ncbi:leucine-rich repeat and calponin homology domain-containing protein 1-like isoform X11 [Mytilus edulis]|uniref:leucine-rich repeat and calponin homology domain-containing protein 1-like isoform X11 n=1 Tax=Mytilus edulis TaxID=6550 RepID=UPI0039F0D711
MATTFSTGTQSPTSHKPLEKIFDEAQSTGAVCLCGRKLREYPKISSRYDLVDTISADLSKNRFSEVPKEVCDHAMLEELNCYHNVIKAIPESIGRLQNLTFINLSRNQLVVIPPFICELVSLEVLIASHNKLISLPEEMGVLDKLMEIDVSCNEISQLPPQIGDLKSLKSLNVRRNMLIELPIELSKLSLRKLDFSNNRISVIPTAFRKIETLEEILLDSNPLTMPPAHLCTKGKKHIMKYLQIEAIKEDRRRGVLNEAEMKRLVRKSLPVSQTSDEFRNILESPEKWKRHTVLSSDSGYSTTDSIEKCGWSASDELQRQQADYNRKKQQAEQIRMQHEEECRRQEEEEDKEKRRRAAHRVQEEQRMLLERQMEEERQREESRLQEERRQQEEAHRKEEHRKREEIRSLEDQKRKEEEHKQKQEAQQYKVENKKLKPRSRTLDNVTRKPGIKTSSLNKEDKKPSNSTQYRRTVSDTAKKLQQPAIKKSNVVKNGPLSPSSSSPSTPLISPSPSPRSSVSSAGPSPASSITSLNKDPKSAGGSIPRRPRTIDKNPAPSTRPSHGNVSRPSTTSTLQSSRTTSRTTGVTNSAVKKNHVTPEEEFRQKHQQMKTQTQVESQKAKSQLESSTSRPRTSMSTTVPRSTNSTLSKRGGTVLTNSAIKQMESYKDSDPNYTIRRQMEYEHGEAKQIDCLRRTIESRLKVTLPDNLPETLRDGVLLCQLANSIRPRSVTSIHVPSPAVPKLTLAKCRKNVENFLEACRKLGVHREQICGAQDILEEKGVTRLAVTTSALIAVSSTNPRSSAV